MIRIRGARTHNLKNINLDLPHHKMIVITGVSGSGKSSLAFDTLYAEGQRRYVESLSAYARQFLQLMQKPDVDSIDGLSPAISIEQKTTSKNPRSTVGTTTEIYDYLRLLFARIGVPYSPATGLPIQAQTVSQMVDRILQQPAQTKLMIMAPIVRDRKGQFQDVGPSLKRRGFQRVWIDGTVHHLDDTLPDLVKNHRHDIAIVVDRIVVPDAVTPEIQQRLAEAIETSLREDTQGIVWVDNAVTGERLVLSSRFACPVSGFTVDALEPRLFSFNSPHGACPTCDGLGVVVRPGQHPATCPRCQGQRLNAQALCVKLRHQDGRTRNLAEVCADTIQGVAAWCAGLDMTEHESAIGERILREIQTRLHFLVSVGLDYLTLARGTATLSGGESQRIRLASQVGSGLTGVLYVLDEPSIGLHQRDNDRLLQALFRLRDLGNTVIVVEHDEDAVRNADFVVDVGPGAGRHGGHIIAACTPEELLICKESLTAQYLNGTQTIDVPAKRRKGRALLALRGATTHNLQNVSVDFPMGTLTCITGVSGGGKSSLVLHTLYQALQKHLRKGNTPEPHHNMMDDGDEESHYSPVTVGTYESIDGLEHVDSVIDIDQAPIGRTPRSNPATYIGAFTLIRDWYAGLPQSRQRGYAPGRFSFNVKGPTGGRCTACEGEGVKRIAMHFLPDVFVPCDTCQGRRYNRETLEVTYKEKSIADVLDMTIDEALEFFEAQAPLRHKLLRLQQVGMGYVQLGQAATTLSGGEAQRIKLAKELSKRSTGRTVYILDEPTTGLHFDDVRKLIAVLQQLVDQGNTVLVIEHHLDVIKTADWIIDLGPEGGSGGGQIVATGTPEEVAQHPQSHTGRYLAKYIDAPQKAA